MADKPLKLIQITDCHLGEHRGDELLSMNPDESLDNVLALIEQQQAAIDLLMVTGDLVNHPSLSAYQRLYDRLDQFTDAPFTWLPGNHDEPTLMAELGKTVNLKCHLLGQWLVVMLDSHLEGQIKGRLQKTELDFLQAVLSQHADKHVIICLHHQPVPIGSAWMDNYIVDNAHEFWATLAPFNHVKAVVWGHVHQQFADQYNGIELLAAPSTCIQFTPGKKDFEVEDSMPGYRWFELYDDGRMETGVERIAYRDLGIDFSSHGY